MAKKNKITYLDSITQEVLAKYRRLDSIIDHAPSKGSYHEKVLREILQRYLPSTYSVGEGFVINKKGETSSQIDILVVDNFDPRSFVYKDNNFFVASNISVTTFGEVKTYCKKKEFHNSIQKLVQTSLVLGGIHASISTSFMFCFDAYASQETFLQWVDETTDKLQSNSELNAENYPDYIFCLKKRVFLEKRHENEGIRYWHVLDTKTRSNTVEQMIMQRLFQCITDGCSRLRKSQGIHLFD